jgi:pyruvate dehydrogenase E1 component
LDSVATETAVLEEVKYGRRLRAKFAEPGGEALHDWTDAMPNEQARRSSGAQPD